MKILEIELDEEKSGAELLNERITRSREQVHRCTLVKGWFSFMSFLFLLCLQAQIEIHIFFFLSRWISSVLN